MLTIVVVVKVVVKIGLHRCGGDDRLVEGTHVVVIVELLSPVFVVSEIGAARSVILKSLLNSIRASISISIVSVFKKNSES